MKVCIIQYNLGATSETFLTRHIELLQDSFEVFCITGNIADNSIIEDHKVFDFTRLSKFNIYFERIKAKFRGERFIYGKSIIDSISKINPDLIVFQFAFIPVLLHRQLNKIKVPFVLVHHGTDLNKARVDSDYKAKLKKVWNNSCAIIFISKFLFDEAVQLGIKNENKYVIRLGVPIATNSVKDVFNKEFNILSVGRLVSVKNHKFLIKGFKVFNDLYPDSVLTIIGDGDLKENLRALIKSFGIMNKVNLTGALPFSEVEKKIIKSNVICLLSKKVEGDNYLQEEGLGLSLIEGAIYSKPLIGTKSGGIPEVVEHGVNGFLVEADDICGLVNALEKLYKKPLLRKKMGENARLKAVNEFNQENQIDKFIMVYRKIIRQEKVISNK